MFELSLNGHWNLSWCQPGEGESLGWPLSGVAGADRLVEATVPGDVHLDLIAAGLIDEPLYGANAPDCQWMEQKDWWYSRTFQLSRAAIRRRVELCFDGLDCSADVYLNGAHVGSARNSFIPHTFDVTNAVRAGTNLLVVRIDDGLRSVADRPTERYRMHDYPEPRLWLRKPQFTFGWDWAPRLLTCGIWRGVHLRSYERAALRDVCLRTRLAPDGTAHVEALCEVENFTDAPRPMRVDVSLARRRQHRAKLVGEAAPGRCELKGEIHIEKPDLWWPQPMGEPSLYDVTAVLSSGRRELDRKAFRYGLREVAIAEEPLEGEGRSFIFLVNGQKVFCKGANWVPADSILARVTPAKYRALLSAAQEANFNMLRVWGGGIFEDDLFYQLCDDYGILVWQDFMYACAYYPDDEPEFLSAAEREAEAAVRRLRNHPCVAL